MIVKLIEDENGELLLPLSDEIMASANFHFGDNLEWIDNHDGSFTLRRVHIEDTPESLNESLTEMLYTFMQSYNMVHWTSDNEQLTMHHVVIGGEYLAIAVPHDLLNYEGSIHISLVNKAGGRTLVYTADTSSMRYVFNAILQNMVQHYPGK